MTIYALLFFNPGENALEISGYYASEEEAYSIADMHPKYDFYVEEVICSNAMAQMLLK